MRFPNRNSVQSIGLRVDKFLRSRAITSGALPRRRVHFSPADDRSRGILRKVKYSSVYFVEYRTFSSKYCVECSEVYPPCLERFESRDRRLSAWRIHFVGLSRCAGTALRLRGKVSDPVLSTEVRWEKGVRGEGGHACAQAICGSPKRARSRF